MHGNYLNSLHYSSSLASTASTSAALLHLERQELAGAGGLFKVCFREIDLLAVEDAPVQRQCVFIQRRQVLVLHHLPRYQTQTQAHRWEGQVQRVVKVRLFESRVSKG